MRITKNKLRNIIKEEIINVLEEVEANKFIDEFYAAVVETHPEFSLTDWKGAPSTALDSLRKDVLGKDAQAYIKSRGGIEKYFPELMRITKDGELVGFIGPRRWKKLLGLAAEEQESRAGDEPSSFRFNKHGDDRSKRITGPNEY